MKKNKKNKAFTIIEFIIVIAVIGILVIIGTPRFIGHVENANMVKHIANVKIMEDGIERFVFDNGRFPRLTNKAYTKDEIQAYSASVLDKTGVKVELDENGHYYDIDYIALRNYVKIPKESDKANYILQNPVGKVFYMDKLTETAKIRADFSIKNPITIPDSELEKNEVVTNIAPTAVISMTPKFDIFTNTVITWDMNLSNDPNNDEIINFEWKNKQATYTTPGNQTVELRVQDSKGEWSEWTMVTFNVVSLNSPPTAVINILPNGAIGPSTNITFNSTFSNDIDGDSIIASEWQLDNNPISISPPNGIISLIGNHNIKLRVKDSKGLWSEWITKQFAVTTYIQTIIPEGTVSASHTDFGNVVKVFTGPIGNGDPLDYGWAAIGVPSWVQIGYNTPQKWTKVSILSWYYRGVEAVKNFDILASNTGSFTGEEVILFSGTHPNDTTNDFISYSFNNSQTYKYYRVKLNTLYPGNGGLDGGLTHVTFSN